jgi:hypothetical protein
MGPPSPPITHSRNEKSFVMAPQPIIIAIIIFHPTSQFPSRENFLNGERFLSFILLFSSINMLAMISQKVLQTQLKKNSNFSLKLRLEFMKPGKLKKIDWRVGKIMEKKTTCLLFCM